MGKFNYKATVCACFIAYVVQSIVCNFAPLLFVGWKKEFDITLSQLTSIIIATFVIQIFVDLISAKYAEKIGYKKCLVISHISSSLGFLLLGILPYVMNNRFLGILVAVFFYSVGSGILEVLISPVVESCPTGNKAAAMSLLHSFYCWGTVMVIGVSTLFFVVFGRDNWRYLSFIWSLFSLMNGLFFCFVPITEPEGNENEQKHGNSLFKSGFFYVAVVLMICAGAGELAMSQWASAFAETGLKVSKTVGDLAGPMAFAVFMGTGRVLFSKLSAKISIEKYISFSALLCIASYLLACVSPISVLSLFGCALCGFSVSVMWPGTISLTTKRTASTSTAMFAFLALAGDIGCTAGPAIIGWATELMGADLKKGLLLAIIFPAIIFISLCPCNRKPNKKA